MAHPVPASPTPSRRTHLVGLHVTREEAAPFHGLVSGQVHGHHGLMPVLLTQLHHLRGPVCGRDAPEPLLAAPRRELPPPRLTVPQPEPSARQGAQGLSSPPNCHGLSAWPSANCSTQGLSFFSEDATRQHTGPWQGPAWKAPRAGLGWVNHKGLCSPLIPTTALMGAGHNPTQQTTRRGPPRLHTEAQNSTHTSVTERVANVPCPRN